MIHAMSSKASTLTAVTAGCGLVTAGAAIATTTSRSDGRWTEAVLVAAAVIFVVAAGWIVVAAGIAASLRAASFFVVPEQPPGLDRISRLIQQSQTERERAAAKHPLGPPPQIVLELRAISTAARH